jgi:hypothetical protein
MLFHCSIHQEKPTRTKVQILTNLELAMADIHEYQALVIEAYDHDDGTYTSSVLVCRLLVCEATSV